MVRVVQEYNLSSGACAMCNVQTSSKSKSTEKFKHLPKCRNFTAVMPLFGNPFYCVQSQAPFHCCFTSSVLWRGSLQKFCQAVRCKPSRFIGEDTLVSQQARLQTIWRSTTKTSKILRRRWHNGRNLVKRACQPRHRPNRPNRRELGRKKATKSVCGPWFVIYELERMLFEIQ